MEKNLEAKVSLESKLWWLSSGLLGYFMTVRLWVQFREQPIIFMDNLMSEFAWCHHFKKMNIWLTHTNKGIKRLKEARGLTQSQHLMQFSNFEY